MDSKLTIKRLLLILVFCTSNTFLLGCEKSISEVVIPKKRQINNDNFNFFKGNRYNNKAFSKSLCQDGKIHSGGLPFSKAKRCDKETLHVSLCRQHRKIHSGGLPFSKAKVCEEKPDTLRYVKKAV